MQQMIQMCVYIAPYVDEGTALYLPRKCTYSILCTLDVANSCVYSVAFV